MKRTRLFPLILHRYVPEDIDERLGLMMRFFEGTAIRQWG
jgi:hypothetical protein